MTLAIVKSGWREHAKRINGAWQKGVQGIIETGTLLNKAKEGPEALPHGEFESMVQLRLNFSPRTAQRLMAIASNSALSKATHVSLLPPSWATLYELTKLERHGLDLHALIQDGTIHPKMERRDVRALLPPPPDHGDEEETPGVEEPKYNASDEETNKFVGRVLDFMAKYSNDFRNWRMTANVTEEGKQVLSSALHQCANELSKLAQDLTLGEGK